MAAAERPLVDWARLGADRVRRGRGGNCQGATAPDAVERRYALRLVNQRPHPAFFRDSVPTAYDHRCAISNLPDDHLLNAAHITADAHEFLGHPVIANGIALSKIHHAAFDNHLIGIDAGGRLLMLHDGPLLEQSLKAIAGRLIRLPRSKQDHPDRDRLAIRFEQFKRAA